MNFVTIYPLADLHYLNFLNQFMTFRSSSGFSHLRPGAFHMLYNHTTDTTYITESGRKKNKQARTWVSIKRKKREVLALFYGFLCIFGYCERISERNSITTTRNADSSSRARWPGFWVHRSQFLAQQPPFSDHR